ncbi:hypothetical protein ACPPVO_20705 [Dactylosporangium sp. McL0621]|uniref:hypothetical protein n=1 Tax=Dactylosporangium sp. McL0621 TaxID=3415678 RepID=UPI003CF9864E
MIANHHRDLEAAVAAATDDWTALRILFPAINSLAFAQQLAHGDVIRAPYPDSSTVAGHEHDVTEAAVTALSQDGHRGKAYDVTGPAALTQADQVAVLGTALGRELHVEGVDPAASSNSSRSSWTAASPTPS